MRTEDDICLLCNVAKATKKNSHIIPKFITNSLLIEDPNRRAYELSTDKVDSEAKFKQSTDMESFILCPECESYFSILETAFCNYVHTPIWDIRKRELLEWLADGDGSIVIAKSIDGLTSRLLLSSIIWRSTISQSHTVKRFKLDEGMSENLRSILMQYKSVKGNELKAKISEPVITFPFRFSLAVLQDSSAVKGKVVFLHPNSPTEGYFIMNNYILTYAFGDSQIMLNLQNDGQSDIPLKVMVVSSKLWNELNKTLIAKFVEKSVTSLRRGSKEYYGFKK